MTFLPADHSHWKGRDDGPRYHHLVRVGEVDQVEAGGFGLLGFSCDEGVRRNQGTVGAAEGPLALREALSKIPAADNLLLTDLGTVVCTGRNLEPAQQALGTLVGRNLQKDVRSLVFGGGHEVAWGHFKGILEAGMAPCGIVNFDAHFDLRPLVDGEKGSSGTPFLQIAEACKERDIPFSYMVLGIQEAGNTPSLFAKAKELGVQVITASEIFQKSSQEIAARLQAFVDQQERLYCSVCMDVFSAALAPGVSAPQTLGLNPWHVLPLLENLAQSKKVIAWDVAELAPPLDIRGMTANLAAQVVHSFVKCG